MGVEALVGACFLNLDEESVWRVVDWDWGESGWTYYALADLEGVKGSREVRRDHLNSAMLYRPLNEMEVIAWMARAS